MSRPIASILLDSAVRSELEAIVKKTKTPQREVKRAQIILARANGLSQQETAKLVDVNRPVVAKWEKRFREKGVAGLAEAHRSGRKSTIDPLIQSQIITEATTPPPGYTQWSSRTMAKAK